MFHDLFQPKQLYPFCFMVPGGLTEFPEMLTKYIYLLGGKEIDVEAICEILKNTQNAEEYINERITYAVLDQL